MKIFDCILIGLGPASISCALYLKRFNYNILLVGLRNSALEKAEMIDNYYGIPHISGNDLFNRGIAQAKDLGIDVLEEEVVEISFLGNFSIKTVNNTYLGKTVFIGIGKSHNLLKAKNVNFYEGKGISYCAICDGFFYRKKRLGLVGNGPFMLNELNVLKNFTSNITIFTNGLQLAVDESLLREFNVKKNKILSVNGEERISSVILDNNDEVEVDGLFIALGTASSVSFAKHLGIILDEEDNIVVNNYMTNILGIFAGGDAIAGIKQVVKAASDGALAAIEINKLLKSKK